MRKAIVLILVLSMLLSIVSCDMMNNNLSTTGSSGTTGVSTTTTSDDDYPFIDEYPWFYLTKQEYEDEISKGKMLEGFIFADQLSEWGSLVEVGAISTKLDGYVWEYAYTLKDGARRIRLTIQHGDSNVEIQGEYWLNHGVKLILEHPSDDLRTYPYTDGDVYYSAYIEDGIVYKYYLGKLDSVYWMHDGIQYCLDSESASGYFSTYPEWRKWPSLFLNKKSNDRAIEFFDMMLDGELPLITDVFGPAYNDGSYMLINNTPCEITWQKPTVPAQTA